jgi:hypothetical protein
MRLSRLFFLLFRYIVLIYVGVSIASLWKICHLDQYESWGRFYAIWIPLLYGFISTAYVIAAECFTRGVPEYPDDGVQSINARFRSYDDYTYLLALWIFVLEISGTFLQNVYLWLSISYLVLVVIKGGLFLVHLYKEVNATLEVGPTSPGDQVDATLKVEPTLPVRIQCLLVLAALILYSLISAYHIQRTTTTGDEPHYLLITHSLWYDHDTNLYNNYKNRDYTSFFWDELQPTWLDQVSETEIYSFRHKGGFPVMLIPGYVLGGRLGAVLEINLITAVLMLQVFLFSYELFHSLLASFFTWLCLSFTIPVIIYMGQIYPDTLAALLTLWGVRRIRMLHLEDSLRNRRFWRNCLYIGITLILLVFLKTRYVLLAGTLVLFLIFHLFQGSLHLKHKMRTVVGVAVTLIVVVLVVVLVDKFFLGHILRDRITDKKYMTWILSGYNPLCGFLGLLFDQEYGVFPYTPLYIFALVGIGMLTRQELKATWSIIGMFSLNYLMIGFWPLWHAAPTPPARYIFPVLPLLGVFLTRFLMQKNGIVKVVVLGTGVIWSCLTAWVVTLNPHWRYNWADGANNLLEMISLHLSVDLIKIFPSWIRISPLTPYLTVLGVVGIGGLIYYCRINSRKSLDSSQDRSFGSHIVMIVSVFIVFSMIGLIIGKKLPSMVLEAEDALDMRTHGGEKVPSASDPWYNQPYLREWKYYGWKLLPGDTLESRPKLFPGELKIEIYARVEFEKRKPKDVPVMLVFVERKEVGRAIVSSPGWNVYTFSVFVSERRPWIEIKHEPAADSKSALIIDKVRFR